MSNVTIVTGFFDLGDTTRSVDWYMDKGKFLLEVDNDMIIFTDSKCYPTIYKIREKFINKTKFILKELSDFELYKYRDKITENRKDDELYKNTRNTSDYFVLVSSKFEMLKISIELNIFNSTHFIWIDFGILNTKHTKKGMIENIIDCIRDKFSCCYIHYRDINFMKNYSNWHRYFQCGIAGGVLSGNIEHLLKVYKLFTTKFINVVEQGYGRAEEQILTEVEAENKDLFDVYPGDYYSVLANYINITEDIDSVLNNFISNARSNNNNQHAYKACEKLETSINLRLVKLNSHQLMKYYTEYFISAWYYNNMKSIDIVKNLMNEMNNNTELCQIFLSNIDYYTSTFDFIRMLLPASKNVAIYRDVTLEEIDKLKETYKVYIYKKDFKLRGDYLLTSNPVIRPSDKIININYDLVIKE